MSSFQPIPYYFRRFVYRADRSAQENMRLKATYYWSVFAVGAILLLTGLAYALGVGILVRFGLVLLAHYAVVYGLVPFLPRFELLNYLMLIGIVLTTFAFMLGCGGLLHSGGLLFVGLNCSFSTVLFRSPRQSIALFALYMLTLLALAALEPRLEVHPDMTPRNNYVFWVINTLWMSAVQLTFIVRYIKDRAALDAAEARRLREADEVKNRFIAQVSHEFRTPLTLLLGMADRVSSLGTEAAEAGRLVRKHALRLLRLVEQMLGLAKLEAGMMELHLVQGDILLLLRYLVEPFQVAARDRGIELRLLAPDTPCIMDFDAEKLELILANLLSNALKHTPDGGRIQVEVCCGQESAPGPPAIADGFRITVRDSGSGIPAAALPRIFDRFYQVENEAGHLARGTGLGLALAREYTELLGGDIAVESRPGEGSAFTLHLPRRRQAAATWDGAGLESPTWLEAELEPEPRGHSEGALFPASQSGPPPKAAPPKATKAAPPKATKAAPPKATEAVPPPETEADLDQPLLLVVEDSPDVAAYLRSLLQDRYAILVAANGRTGWELARQRVPDIIISDVMMPEMDGFELLGLLKTHTETSHIPVILLTARADNASRLEGLERGADAYLTKPFRRDELFVRLRKLLEQRRLLQQRYAEPHRPRPAPDDSPSLEDTFLHRVNQTLEQHLDEADFDIDRLARALGMSRTQLYRKFRMLTDTTVHRHMRRYRLHRARSLLEAGDLNVSEVAFEVGIPNLSSFSRAFTEEFGVNPSQLRIS